MICLYCAIRLKGFADSQIIRRRGEASVMCSDSEACQRRQANNQRAAQGLPPIERKLAPVLAFPPKSE